LAVLQGRCDGLEAKVRRSLEASQVLHHHQAAALAQPLWWGQRFRRQRPMPRWTSARAQGGGHHLQLNDLQLSLEPSFTGQGTCCARSCGPATSAIRSLRWHAGPTRIAAWKVAFRGRLRPQIPWHRASSTTRQPARRRLQPPAVGGRVGPGRHAAPLASVYPADTSLERAHPQRGNRWPTTKPRCRCPASGAVQRLSVSAPTNVAANGNLRQSK